MKIIVGNWKMYKTIEEAVAYVHELSSLIESGDAQVCLGVPFTAIHAVAAKAKGTKIKIGAQNMHDAAEGAFTGEISSRMLKEAGATFVILGHSERRQFFGDTNEWICRKIKRALSEGLTPILCIGESQQERDAGKTGDVLCKQLEECLNGIEASSDITIAYEPIWAIGTGRTASPEMAQEAHQICRAFIEKKWGKEKAQKTPILYGGSVKPETIASLMEQPDINGALVGGASLDPKTFAKMINV